MYKAPPKSHLSMKESSKMGGVPRSFPSIALCSPRNRESHSVAADLDGTLLVSRSSFPYFFLLATEAGSLLRGLALLIFAPTILFLYRLVSEAAGIKLMIFVSLAGLKMHDIERVSEAVLPKFYASDVRAESWKVFRGCGRRRVVVTANPVVMVEKFVKEQLGGDMVLGTELEVDGRTGRATGFVTGNGVLVGGKKREAVVVEFGEELPELGLGDRETDHDFMALCNEAYMVLPDRNAAKLPSRLLDAPVVFHDGRLVRRPEPLNAILTFLYLPLGFLLAFLRIALYLLVPTRLIRYPFRLSGITLSIRGTPPPPCSPGSLLVCNHQTPLDHVIISIALGRKVARLEKHDATSTQIATLLQEGDVVVCPEGTTCRGDYIMKFTSMFAEASDRIVPVAVVARQGVFYGTTASGWKFMDALFFLMNPRPGYEVTFLDRLTVEETCGGGRSADEVASKVQKVLGEELGFECTEFTRREKYLKLGGNESKNE